MSFASGVVWFRYAVPLCDGWRVERLVPVGFTDAVNSVLCGPANVLTPLLVKPVITRDPLINSETEMKQWTNWG